MQYGFQNEINFAKYLDHKKYSQLSKDYKELIKALFAEVDNNSKIDCWRSQRKEKADIKIKVNNEVKGISIKIGHNCSVHQENSESLFRFFDKIGVENKVITYIRKFLEGYSNGVRVDAISYIERNEDEIEKIKNSLNQYYIKANLIIRFLFLGTEKQNYDCDAIIYGKPEKFLWATKSEIFHYLLECETPKVQRINFGSLSLKSYDRNLRNNPLRRAKEKDIQIKWYTIEKDMLIIKELRDNYEKNLKNNQ